MRKPALLLIVAFLLAAMSLTGQDLTIPLPEGEGYAVKKESPAPHTRWELKIVNQSAPLAATESVILSPESFYMHQFSEEMKKMEFDPTGEKAVMDASYFQTLQSLPIERRVETPDYEEGKEQVDAFLDGYNQMLRQAPADEPIEFIIDRAAWQYWYNQMSMWEQYIGSKIFLKKNMPSSLEKLDFSTRDALNGAVANLANSLNEQADEIEKDNHRKNLTFIHRLEQRDTQRKDYSQWLDDQEYLVSKFTRTWARKQEGKELNIEGTVYLVSDEPLERTPRNTVNLVTDKVTPYDLLNTDGTIKKPLE